MLLKKIFRDRDRDRDRLTKVTCLTVYALYAFYALGGLGVVCIGGLFSVIGGPCKRYHNVVARTRMPGQNPCLGNSHGLKKNPRVTHDFTWP
jgi:hypothetical protein